MRSHGGTTMLFIRLCYDKPSTTAAMRDEHRAAHRAYLGSTDVKLVQAGPLLGEGDTRKEIASFMIIDAEGLDQAERFNEGDPFTKAGLFGEVHIHRWEKHVG